MLWDRSGNGKNKYEKHFYLEIMGLFILSKIESWDILLSSVFPKNQWLYLIWRTVNYGSLQHVQIAAAMNSAKLQIWIRSQ